MKHCNSLFGFSTEFRSIARETFGKRESCLSWIRFNRQGYNCIKLRIESVNSLVWKLIRTDSILALVTSGRHPLRFSDNRWSKFGRTVSWLVFLLATFSQSDGHSIAVGDDHDLFRRIIDNYQIDSAAETRGLGYRDNSYSIFNVPKCMHSDYKWKKKYNNECYRNVLDRWMYMYVPIYYMEI